MAPAVYTSGAFPVDGNFIGGVAAKIIHVTLGSNEAGVLAGTTVVIYILWVWATRQKSRHRFGHIVSARLPVVNIYWRYSPKTCHEAIFGGISPQEIIHGSYGSIQVVHVFRQLIGIHQQHPLIAGDTITSPVEVIVWNEVREVFFW